MPPPRSNAPAPSVVFVLYGALFATTFVYLGLLLTVIQPPPGTSMPLEMLAALGAAALFAGVGSFVVPRMLGSAGPARLAKSAALREVGDDEHAVRFGAAPATRKVFADPIAAMQLVHQANFTPFILRLALSEAVAIFGLVARFSGAPLPYVLPFFVVSWVLFALHFPRPAAWKRAFEEAAGATFE